MTNGTMMVLILAALAVGILVGFVAYKVYRDNRSRHLRRHFGPEYTRLAEEKGTDAAERELEEREKRATGFHIRPLSPEQKNRFISRWQGVQEEFVDRPKDSLAHADELLGEAMATRGYPVQDFEQRAADLSVEHPVVVQHYHQAHAIALRHRDGKASTEDMRQAMLHYRALFEEVVSETPRQAAE